MNQQERNMGMEGSTRFRALVGSLVENSALFPVRKIGSNEELTILDAIEKNELMLYVPERASDRMIDAVECLTYIYDELKKEEPDEDFIANTVKQLKGNL